MITDRLTCGILAHVDAGKTTLAEALLYQSGSIKKAGRVDKGDAYLDTDEIEKDRGITIFSKCAILNAGDKRITLLDTPGHVDFSAEMERALMVMDYAILVISASEGVQSHTVTLAKLLQQYEIPTFLFINKMDLQGAERGAIMAGLQEEFNGSCVDFTDGLPEESTEQIALSDEKLLDLYLAGEVIDKADIAKVIRQRKVFPCFFGSALKMDKVQEFLNALDEFCICPECSDEFAARAFKITRDEKNARLTWLKITGGSLKVKDEIQTSGPEKVNQIRLYNGEKYEAVDEAVAGEICAVTGLDRSKAGDVYGDDAFGFKSEFGSVLSYSIIPPDGMSAADLYQKLSPLAEESPDLELKWIEDLAEIRVNLMGEVQIEVLKTYIKRRFGIEVGFGTGSIIYKETIEETVEGIGHFEPLRHYAEAHVLIEPGERNSGLKFASKVSEDALDKNWQRLILTHLIEREHRGVLTGAPITDVKLTVIGGRAHNKHTEGGDFREASYRAVRQGLMSAKSVLLEPWYEIRLEVPTSALGRAIHDLEMRSARFDAPAQDADVAVLEAKAPVACMRDYATEVASYTGGKGKLSLKLCGYDVCHNSDEVIAESGYDADSDLANPSSSVFCHKGSATVIPWDEVPENAHVQSEWARQKRQLEKLNEQQTERRHRASDYNGEMPPAYSAGERELKEIFERTYGKSDVKLYRTSNESRADEHYDESARDSSNDWTKPGRKTVSPKDRYLLVDGYNIIFAWEELRSLSETNIDSAKDRLMDVLSNYQGFRGMKLILVFDAYKVKGAQVSVTHYHNIDVVYTREAQTADAYIEKVTKELSKDNDVTVATSDGVEQMIIWGHGARRMSATELKEEIERTNEEMKEYY